MITAAEARELSEKNLGGIVERQLREVEDLIKRACEAGEFYTIYQEDLKEETQKILIEAGYDIEDDRVIIWEFPYDDEYEMTLDNFDDDYDDYGEDIEQEQPTIEEILFGSDEE